jgi:hypothetical protein
MDKGINIMGENNMEQTPEAITTEADNTLLPEQTVEEAVTTEPDNKDEFAARFMALSRKEKRLQESQVSLKKQEERLKELDSIKEAGVMKALEYHGFTIDDVVNYALGESDKPPVDPVDALKSEFDNYKQSIEEEKAQKKAQEEEINQKHIEDTVNAHKTQIDQFIRQNPAKYELINAQDSGDLVWEVTEQHFQEYGELLSIEDASNKVESFLENQVKDLLKLKKFSPQEEIQDNNAASKTLKSDAGASVPVREKTFSREESLKQAAKLLKWT